MTTEACRLCGRGGDPEREVSHEIGLITVQEERARYRKALERIVTESMDAQDIVIARDALRDA